MASRGVFTVFPAVCGGLRRGLRQMMQERESELQDLVAEGASLSMKSAVKALKS